MASERLNIFVEGPNDVRFFELIVKPLFESTYSCVNVIPYAQESTKKITKFIRSFKRQQSDYIFVNDLELSKCITLRKNKLSKKYKELEIDRIIIVVRMIEGWYLSSLNNESSRRLGIRKICRTETVNKAVFENKRNNSKLGSDSEIDFMTELLRDYSIEMARQHNCSFNYFLSKFIGI